MQDCSIVGISEFNPFFLGGGGGGGGGNVGKVRELINITSIACKHRVL